MARSSHLYLVITLCQTLYLATPITGYILSPRNYYQTISSGPGYNIPKNAVIDHESLSSSSLSRYSTINVRRRRLQRQQGAGYFYQMMAIDDNEDSRYDQNAERAGSSGYSVLRQPVKWDPEKDPTFDVPAALNDDEENNNKRQLDEEFWLGKNNYNNDREQQQLSTPFKKEGQKQQLHKEKSEHLPGSNELDLHQRTLDTLDYSIILNALQNECATVPGRSIVSEANIVDTTEDGSSESGKKKKNGQRQKQKKNNPRAFMSLTSDSFEGMMERYDAVKEMTYLMSQNDNNEDFYHVSPEEEKEQNEISKVLDGAKWKNRKGFKESFSTPPFQGMSFNFQSIIDLVDNGGQVLEGPEILEVATMLDVMEDVTLWSKGLEKIGNDDDSTRVARLFKELPKFGDCISVNATLQELLHNAFDDKGRLSGQTFAQIGILRSKVRTLKRDILSTLDNLLTMPSIAKNIALESGGPMYSEINGRIVIPIDEGNKRSANIGIVHDSSRSGKTVYVEPTEIVTPTNELRQAESELRSEEIRVWRLLTEQILWNRNEIETSVASIGQLDLVVARVSLGKQIKGVIPEVKNEGIISLKNAKHPVLLLRQLDNVVGSDINIGAGENQGLVLTGPNSGGKTVILKLLGLVALMARNGLPVPAASSAAAAAASLNGDLATSYNDNLDIRNTYKPRVDFFNPILADIGDLQSVDGDLSTFSGHMLVCREVLANSGKNALVLMDELGSGTDPNQGVAIAQALLEALLETGARVAITTHYMALKQLATSDNRFDVGGMQFVNGRPTYKLLPGTIGESFALAVAERLELPPSVIDRANELLDAETRQMGDLIRELEDQKSLIDQQILELAEQKKNMTKLELEMKSQQRKLESKQLSARRDEAKKFAAKLEEKEQVLEDIMEKLKKDPSRKVIAKSWDEVKYVKRDALTEAENIPSVIAMKAKAAKEQAKQTEILSSELVPIAEIRDKPDLNVGDTLVVCKKNSPLFGRECKILKVGKQVQVNIGGIVTSLKLTEVALPNSGFVAPKNKKRNQGGPRNLSKQTDKLLQEEMKQGGGPSSLSNAVTTNRSKKDASIRTQSNTIDIRGCYAEEAKTNCEIKFSQSSMAGRNVVYILHGHGTTGVLKNKIRDWLKSSKLVKSFQSADSSDGGDAFTKVELR